VTAEGAFFPARIAFCYFLDHRRMAKTFEKAVTGFNHNIKHKGKVYHVQTEDSGVNNPHIITHLFVGGNILASKKQSYGDRLTVPNVPDVVREMMEEQHKAMLRNLVNGSYDNVDNSASRSFQPGQLDVSCAIAPLIAPVALAAPTPSQPAPIQLTSPLPPPVALVPPVAPGVLAEVLAARAMKEAPKENNIGVETLFGEDLISEKSLDEVILSYLAGDGST
jgi:hypothetical protein